MAPHTPPTSGRTLTPLDHFIASTDRALRTVFGTVHPSRPYPAEGITETVETHEERNHVAALMRVNHSGEIAAQALYQGQALVAKSAATREAMLAAGREETDHLVWCSQRIRELGGRTSLLNPIWYSGSFALGALAGVISDRASLGFVAETERQVVDHLNAHVEQLPERDERTKAIIAKMTDDEARHGENALSAGGVRLPALVRTLMRISAKVMTRTAYCI